MHQKRQPSVPIFASRPNHQSQQHDANFQPTTSNRDAIIWLVNGPVKEGKRSAVIAIAASRIRPNTLTPISVCMVHAGVYFGFQTHTSTSSICMFRFLDPRPFFLVNSNLSFHQLILLVLLLPSSFAAFTFKFFDLRSSNHSPWTLPNLNSRQTIKNSRLAMLVIKRVFERPA